MKQIVKSFVMAMAVTASLPVYAAAPSGYYSSCENKGGKSLLTALHSTIGAHTTVSYKGLLDLYKTSDVYPDGKIWDMYSPVCQCLVEYMSQILPSGYTSDVL